MGKRFTIALAVLAILAILLGTYTAGYLWLGKRHVWYGTLQMSTHGPTSIDTIERIYPQRWMMMFYRPATKVESWWEGVEVQATWSEEPLFDAVHYST